MSICSTSCSTVRCHPPTAIGEHRTRCQPNIAQSFSPCILPLHCGGNITWYNTIHGSCTLTAYTSAFIMKVGTLVGADITNSFFAPMKTWLNIGWFIGIFPVSYDKNLSQFRFKFNSFWTYFALFRLMVLVMCLLLPGFVMNEIEKSERQNMTDSQFYQLNITNITTYQTYFDFVASGFNKTGDFGVQNDKNDYLLSRFYLFLPVLSLLGKA